MRQLAGALVLVVALAAACTSDGDSAPPTTSTPTTVAAPPIPVNTALPEHSFERRVDDYLSWKMRVYVATDGPTPRYCLALTLIIAFTLNPEPTVDEKVACTTTPRLEMFAGPVIERATVYFGVAGHDTDRVRLYDKANNVVDSAMDIVGRYPFRAWVVAVPASYKADRVKAFNPNDKELRSTTLTAS